ncbi:peptidylprolyl isomerase [Aquimarina gracilis]|uniref:Peptidylprolyl isomerase n=1 Tax=Aquimarina gracilis TaxID=874422 RepID=A0ABU5ZYL6_9FLAO|nr:peptidylprolyl isomerase [Aquimarina gracilis]MEB3346992.1 peptidylprolyl isomerase [Aquimarina gracilis]
MHKKSVLFFLGVLFFTLTTAQHKEEVLLSIADSPVYLSEFKRIYLKNIDLVKDDSQKDVDEYLELFVNYKLKLKEAKALGLDKKESYIKELEGYKEQLAANYLTDTKASDALIKEAYNRSLERVKARHILIMVKPNASAKDTAIAYQKIVNIKDEIDKGGDFEVIAKEYSEDPSVVKNGGQLGWFSAFRMVYPFESAAYNTQVGAVSDPFRTQFGYHILQVEEREKKLGDVSVAHIMIAVNESRTEQEAEIRIKEVKQQLDQGVSFSSLAKQYSDDPSTAIDGGKIRRFGQGALNSEKFEKTAFDLQKKGELSAPIKTKYGWHIIKLLEKHPPKTYEEQKTELTNKVKRDSRSKLVTKSFINSLKKKYSISKNEEGIAYFKKLISNENPVDELNNWNGEQDKVLFKIKEKSYIYKDFVVFILPEIMKFHPKKVVPSFIDQMYDKFESSSLLNYYEEHLEEDNQDYANIIGEYRDGLLLFDLMDTEIWNTSKTDSITLRNFYEERKENYYQNETYRVLKASSARRDIINKVKQLLEKGESISEIKKEVNKGDIVLVIFSEEEWVKGVDELPKGFSAKKSELTITEEDNFVTLIMVKEILPSRIRTFEEIKGEIINDFQETRERNWLSELREKYPVKVNQKTLKRVKKELLK